MYLLVAREMDYLVLYKKGSIQDANAWPYIVYPQLVKKKLPEKIKEYRIMNDAFIFKIIQFIEGDYMKWILEEVFSKISEVGAYYIHYSIFTYLRVVGTTINLKKIPRYPDVDLFYWILLDNSCMHMKKLERNKKYVGYGLSL